MDPATANVWIAGLLSGGGIAVTAICKLVPRRNGNGEARRMSAMEQRQSRLEAQYEEILRWLERIEDKME